ncbi:hypothetical protein DAPPUDRAFT_108328 [Daphnia pulex]|uniref:Uncharacterized protein n=1 Tax=Daphnia pulex TaxID=6669 RepID=E9GZU4_DAPPU|nr:hypothetical protein DAPPUDRAFT_108328 [Daphnia pulex]|eukprot:EFX74872.1 hypothetical protein DAPPUDRAFT_108328 [Daphnia pulex]
MRNTATSLLNMTRTLQKRKQRRVLSLIVGYSVACLSKSNNEATSTENPTVLDDDSQSSSSDAILEDISISFDYFKNAQISKRKSRAPSLIAEPSLLNDEATQVERSLSNTNRSLKHN